MFYIPKDIDEKLHYYIYEQTMISILKNIQKVILKKLFLSSFPNSYCLMEERMSLFENKQIFDTALPFKCNLSKAESRIERDFIFYS